MNRSATRAGQADRSPLVPERDLNDVVRSPLCAPHAVTAVSSPAGYWQLRPGLDSGAHRRYERNGNGHANANPEARRDITVPRWRWWWRWRWWERCRHAGVGRRIEHGPPPAFDRITHPRRNQCHECERSQRGRAEDCQTVNHAHHRRPPSDLPRPRSDQDLTPGRPPVSPQLTIRKRPHRSLVAPNHRPGFAFGARYCCASRPPRRRSSAAA